MRLAQRTGLAAFAAATLSLLAIVVLFQGQFNRVLVSRVDAQLTDRADNAPILAAVADRLARSELSGTVQGARVLALAPGDDPAAGVGDSDVIELGALPEDSLPPIGEPGFATVAADGQRWRLLTIEVADVPAVGDRALVQLVAPLGDVEAAAARLRRRATLIGLVTAACAGLVGALLGALAARPMTALRRDTDGIGDADPTRWRIGTAYGSVEVDDVAAALNRTLARLATETERRGEALASARSFASTASHELRVPLQAALTNLNLAADGRLGPAERREVITVAGEQLLRMADSLGAVRALAEAELADPSWLRPTDLAEVVDRAVADEARRDGALVEIVVADGAEDARVGLWADGVRLAVANVVRNASVHGRRGDGAAPRVVVAVDPASATVTVDDDGPGFPAAGDRRRLLDRFERGSSDRGSGLGLAIANQVAAAHGGGIELADSPLGGARVTLRLSP